MEHSNQLPVTEPETEVARRASFGFPDSPSAAEVGRWARQEGFLAAYVASGRLYLSAAESGSSVGAHEKWVSMDTWGYQKRYAAAQQEYLETIVSELSRRAFDGTEKKFFNSKGEFTGSTTQYSDILGMFLVKQRDPSYRDNVTLTLDVPDDLRVYLQQKQEADAVARAALPEPEIIEHEPKDEPAPWEEGS